MAKRTGRPAGYSGTPLPKKLGIKEGCTVAVVDAPGGVAATLGGLPAGATISDAPDAACDLIVWFMRSRAQLAGAIDRIARRVPRGGAWIAWPKKAAAVRSDLSEAEVRRAALAAGLVDYKVCAIDETWSGLLFTRRK